jgi:hypothetical protein
MQEPTEVDTMTKMTKMLVSIALLVAAPLALACDYPAPPKDLPNGAIAEKEEMLAGVKLISKYQEDMTVYLSCIEAGQIVAVQAFADDDDESKARSKSNFDKRYNAAVEEQTKTVEIFNLEIRAYKAR